MTEGEELTESALRRSQEFPNVIAHHARGHAAGSTPRRAPVVTTRLFDPFTAPVAIAAGKSVRAARMVRGTPTVEGWHIS